MKFKFLILIAFSFFLSSCFKKYIVTEKEIKQHYDTLGFKPNYKVQKGLDYKLFTATFGLDTLQPILFIHGAPGRWEGYRKQLDDTFYHSKYHLLAPDRPGYGFSYYKKKHKKVSIEKQAQLLEKTFELNLSDKKPIIVTRSYGAPIGAYMVAKNPEKYAKLIMMAPAIDPDNEKFFKFTKYGKWPVLRWFIPNRFVTATDEKYDHVKELRAMEDIWGKITIPTVVMYGGKDWVVTTENFEYAKKKLPSDSTKTFIFIPEAGHRISRSHAELLKEEIVK
ncbi:alpha/beta hydrolase [Lacihabitans sp. LS3-19]|uniref:alpha/beta fold hydrolase n=1 Tax=Lacihabitans sp. LS3-19 TaxID=2487335 RepID=UPI0020CD07C5|nr:alpha/beta hydrolase [Lacihabitans sp. LS3-19]MCP9769976.1 alpha/beta hydrolase [Lacihabitans sp. LS3-19]